MAKKTVALAWSGNESAPVVIARGKDALAERMLEIAQSCGIPIVDDPLLSETLSVVDVGTCVPYETWEAVAAIFAFLEKGLAENTF